MSLKRVLYFLIVAVAGLGLYWAASPRKLEAQQAGQGLRVDADDIGGVVTSSKGPEAGVWVIAETTDLLSRKLLVCDALGARGERIPWRGRIGQRHLDEY